MTWIVADLKLHIPQKDIIVTDTDPDIPDPTQTNAVSNDLVLTTLDMIRTCRDGDH